MYDTHDYLWGLGIYACGGLLILLFLFSYRKLVPWRHLRNVLFLLVTVVIFTPVTAYPDKHYLAPAWFVTFYEAATLKEPDSFVRGLTPLLICMVAALLAYIAVQFFLWYFLRRNRQVESSEPIQQQEETS